MTMGIACGHYLAIMSSIEHALINGSKKFTGAFYDLLYTFPQRELNPETLVTFCYLFISFVSGYALYVDGTSADLPEVDAALQHQHALFFLDRVLPTQRYLSVLI